MKGFAEWIVALPLLAALVIVFIASPLDIDIKIKQIYVENVESIETQDTLTSVLHAFNMDTLGGGRKPTYEIVGEKLLLPEQNIDFLKSDLESLVTSKCFVLDVGKPKQYTLIDQGCSDLMEKGYKTTAKMVLPYNSDKLTENITLVVK